MADVTQVPASRRSIAPWLKTPLALAAALLAAVGVLDPGNLTDTAAFAARALAGTAPDILIAVVMRADLKATGAETLVAATFKGRETRMIVLAAVFGGLAPFCSCRMAFSCSSG